MRFSKAILVATSIIAIGLCTSGCSSSSTSSNSSKSSAQVSSAKKEESHIVGSYRDDADGAAITLNSDGTGTYVMANPTQADIHDQLT
ncbi:DUF3642 domain-containing protein [Limosilactobacillus reuteri]|nr:DUF3642 domain-containing protein [Limosilactobacillus reuteri]